MAFLMGEVGKEELELVALTPVREHYHPCENVVHLKKGVIEMW